MSLGEHKENNEHFGLKGTKRNHDACTTYEELVGKLSNSVTSVGHAPTSSMMQFLHINAGKIVLR